MHLFYQHCGHNGLFFLLMWSLGLRTRLWLTEEYHFIILTFFKLTPFSLKIPWDPSLPNSTGWKYLLAGFMLDPSVAPKKRDQQEALPQSAPLSECWCHRSRQSGTCEHFGGNYISIRPCHCTVKQCRVSCYTKHTHGQTGHRGEGGKKWSQDIKRCRKTAGKVKRRSDLTIRHLRQLPLSNWTLLTVHWLAKVSVTEQFCLGLHVWSHLAAKMKNCAELKIRTLVMFWRMELLKTAACCICMRVCQSLFSVVACSPPKCFVVLSLVYTSASQRRRGYGSEHQPSLSVFISESR